KRSVRVGSVADLDDSRRGGAVGGRDRELVAPLAAHVELRIVPAGRHAGDNKTRFRVDDLDFAVIGKQAVRECQRMDKLFLCTARVASFAGTVEADAIERLQ